MDLDAAFEVSMKVRVSVILNKQGRTHDSTRINDNYWRAKALCAGWTPSLSKMCLSHV
jgi:hypothetical protein